MIKQMYYVVTQQYRNKTVTVEGIQVSVMDVLGAYASLSDALEAVERAKNIFIPRDFVDFSSGWCHYWVSTDNEVEIKITQRHLTPKK